MAAIKAYGLKMYRGFRSANSYRHWLRKRPCGVLPSAKQAQAQIDAWFSPAQTDKDSYYLFHGIALELQPKFALDSKAIHVS